MAISGWGEVIKPNLSELCSSFNQSLEPVDSGDFLNLAILVILAFLVNLVILLDLLMLVNLVNPYGSQMDQGVAAIPCFQKIYALSGFQYHAVEKRLDVTIGRMDEKVKIGQESTNQDLQ